MLSKSKLLAVFSKVKKTSEYDFYEFEDFERNAKAFIKDIRKHRVIAGMEVSRSGMQRKFNTQRYNMLLNICYNGKKSWDPVKVGGCGMDMYWHLLFRTCESLVTQKEMEKWGLNLECSHQTIL